MCETRSEDKQYDILLWTYCGTFRPFSLAFLTIGRFIPILGFSYCFFSNNIEYAAIRQATWFNRMIREEIFWSVIFTFKVPPTLFNYSLVLFVNMINGINISDVWN